MDIAGTIDSWKKQHSDSDFTVYSPVKTELLRETVSELGLFPAELLELYGYCNGLSLNWFRIFPIEDKTHIKKTWDGIKRANDPKKSSYLGKDQGLFQRFLIFANLGGGTCAVIDRADESIWYEENGELHQTDFSILDFIDTCLREAKEIS
jgi:hypothetical protein